MSRGWEKPGLTKTPTPDVMSSIISSMNEEEKACHRAAFLHFLTSMVNGNNEVETTMNDGNTFKGTFYTARPLQKGDDYVIALKNAKPINKDGIEGKTIVIPAKSFTCLKVASVDLAPKGAGGRELQTDSSIRGRDVSHLVDRELQSASAWLDPNSMTELESSGNGNGNGKPFDQFEANQRLFGVKNTYNEDYYTKSLDTSKMTKDQLDKAARIAKEIEGQQSSNIHMQEERGHAIEREIDEEDLYSGVLRKPEKESVWKRGVPQKVNSSSPKQGPPPPKAKTPGKVEAGKPKKSLSGDLDANTPPPGLDITSKEGNFVQEKTPSPSLTQEVATMELSEDKTSSNQEENNKNDKTVEIKESGSTTSKLRADAPEFKFNANATEFKPSFMAGGSPAAVRPMPMQVPVGVPMFVPQDEMMDPQYMDGRMLPQGQGYGVGPPMQIYGQNQGMGMMDGMGMPMPQYPQQGMPPNFYPQPIMQRLPDGRIVPVGPGPMMMGQPMMMGFQPGPGPMMMGQPMMMGNQGQYHHHEGGRGRGGGGSNHQGGRGNHQGRGGGNWSEGRGGPESAEASEEPKN